MKNFVELLVVADDKANAEDLALAAEKLNTRQVASIPRCLYRYIHPDGTEVLLGEAPGADDLSIPDIDVLVALSWVRARRDDPDIEYETVKKSIPVTDSDAIREINKELFYFFTDRTREDVEAVFGSIEDENPPETPEPQSDSASQTSSEA